MKWSRWLRDARTIEAETGWSRPVCQRLAAVGAGDGGGWAGFYWIGGLVLVAAPAATTAALWAADPDATELGWLLGRIVLLGVSAGVLLALVTLAARACLAFRTRRMLRRYLEAPWCLRCRYPVPSPRIAHTSVCPECGEPIPAEVVAAAIASERRSARLRAASS